MKFVIYSLLVFVLLLIGKPEPYEEGIQNIHIYVILLCLLAIYLIYRLIKRAVIAYKIRKALEKNRTRIRKFSVLPRSYGKRGTFDIVADGRNNTVNIVIIARKNKHTRYHFDSPALLEYYIGGRFQGSWLGHRRFVRQVGTVDNTKLVGKRRLPWREIDERDVNIIVFDKLPVAVSDSVSRETVCNGQKLCGKIYLYDFESFKANIDNLI